MAFNRFYDLSQDFSATGFSPIFNTSGLSGASSLMSLSSESEAMVRWVRYKLGEPILTVELDNNQIMAAFEEANLEYSRILHTLQISNNFATVFGLNQDYNAHDLKMKIPQETFAFLRKYTKNFGIFGPMPVGGGVVSRRGYFDSIVGQQNYNIYDELYDETTSSSLRNYILNSSLSSNNSIPLITKVHHQAPISLNRFFDPWSNISMMNQEFNLESYAVGSNYFMLPVWNDILRGQVFKQGDLVRRSNFSYNQIGDRLQIFPSPRRGVKIWFEWFPEPDPFDQATSLTGSASSQLNQINAIWNAPASDIKYSEMNPTARQWVKQYACAVAKEILGGIRNKFASLPIPNGDVQLNGSELISQAREDMQRLREDLKTDLEPFKKENLMEKEAKMMEMTYAQLKYFPLGGPILG